MYNIEYTDLTLDRVIEMRKLYLLIITLLMMLSGIKASAMADSAKGACLLNAVTGEIVFEKNGDEPRPMASTTKIMTLLTAVECAKPDDIVTIPHEVVMTEGSSAYLEEGAKYSMRDLWYGLMLNSGNDAAVAIAYHISGSVEAFAEEMNSRARSIGVKNTSFKNPNGLDEEGHYTTPIDLAKITQYALNNEQFAEVVAARSHTAQYTRADGTEKTIEYINHNRLLREVEGCIGVKTGYTKADGRCLVSAAERDGIRFIAVTLNDPDDWAEHKEMLESGFSGCRMVKAVRENDVIRHVISEGKEICQLVAATDFDIPTNGDRGHEFDIKVNLPNRTYMPLNEDEKIGELEIYRGDDFIGKVDVVADRTVLEESEVKTKRCFWFSALTILRNLLR